jgi:hypothetical protein
MDIGEGVPAGAPHDHLFALFRPLEQRTGTNAKLVLYLRGHRNLTLGRNLRTGAHVDTCLALYLSAAWSWERK